MHARGSLIAASLGAALLYACLPSSTQYADWDAGKGGAISSSSSSGELGFDAGGQTGPPPPDAGGLCGNDLHKIQFNPPNVYFILDTSGSMQAPASGGNSRYTVLQHAAAGIVQHLHLLINVGAATFPGDVDQCAPGHEVFPVAYDDAVGFDKATKYIIPGGGTPTAATLYSLVPKLASLSGKTVAVLVTDGGPNCNAAAACDKGECMENIEGCPSSDTCCALGQNCCAPSGSAGPLNCVDHQPAVNAVKALAAVGIQVFVVGIPGSKAYAQVLADMALAGGAALGTYPFYYAVDDLTTLSNILSAAAGSAIPCDFKLDAAPMDPSLTNVYFDQKVVLQDPKDGWTWSAPDQVTVHGAACAALHAGQVEQVQIVSGCPTEATK